MSVYGIDLGTTYACIAKVNDDGMVEVIRNEADQKTSLASAIFFDDDGNYYIGDAAKEAMIDAPERLCQFFKRYIGRPGLLEMARENEPDLYIIDGVEHDPVELSALVLKKVCAYCEEQGETVREAVITYPADFGASEKEATLKAAESAGIHVLDMVSDVAAAAMNYARTLEWDNIGEHKEVLLYHLGGGTFSTALMQLTRQENGVLSIQMLGESGDNDLGGKDWDQSLEDLVKRKLAEEIECSVDDISQDVTFNIRSLVEKNKQALTEKTSVNFKLIDDDGGKRKISVTREEFDEATSLHLSNTMLLVQSVLQKNAMNPKDVDAILLDGGSTLMPQVKTALSKMFDEDKIYLSDPYQSIAKGAAFIAENIKKSGSPNMVFTLNTEEPIPPKPPHNANRSPVSFGFIKADDFDEAGNATNYNVHNFLTVGEEIPQGALDLGYITNSILQSSFVMILATSLSPRKLIPVKRAADNSFYSEDISIDLKTITWRIPIRTPHAEHEYIPIYFSMNKNGEILLEAENSEAGVLSELELQYCITYTIKRLNVNQKKC